MSNTISYLLPSLVSLVALIVYFASLINVGRARLKYGIKPPATAGNEGFERAFRIQMNTLEQLVIFLPALWLYAFYVSAKWAAIIGAAWIIGRIAYSVGYSLDVRSRQPGFVLSTFATMTLLIGSGIGLIKCLVHY